MRVPPSLRRHGAQPSVHVHQAAPPPARRHGPPSLPGPSVDVAALQIPHRFGDPGRALAQLDELLGHPALAGVQLVLLPETSLTGYVSPRGDFNLRPFAEPLEGPTAGALSDLARRHGIALAGPLVEDEKPRYYNSLLLFDREGRRVGHWRKRHPWLPERWATPGDLGTPVIEMFGLRIAAAICFDINFITVVAGPALDEADVLLFPSAWVDTPGHADMRDGLLPRIARRHRVALVNANWGPPVDPARGPYAHLLAGQGGSRIVNARGRVLAKAGLELGVEIVRATLSSARVPSAEPSRPTSLGG